MEFEKVKVKIEVKPQPSQTSLTVASPGQASVTGNEFVPKTPELFYYDLDGNLTNDGHWTYYWDAENRLVAMKANTSAGPQISLRFEYDSKSRRIRKQVWDNIAWTGSSTNDLQFIYDGWNLIAELSNSHSALRTYTWGLDLSGSIQGAGGVGGLIGMNDFANGFHFTAFDGNGNVSFLVKARDGSAAAGFDFDPFGELLRGTGPMAKANPFRFSTKYQDDETDLAYFGFRYYAKTRGGWTSRDPIGLRGGLSPYTFVRNRPIDLIDPDGQFTRAGGTEAWSPGMDVVFGGATIGTAQVWLNASVPDAPEFLNQAIWLQFNKAAGAPTCKWTQFITREALDPEGSPIEGGYSLGLVFFRRYGQRYLDNFADWRYQGDLATSTTLLEAVYDQPDARGGLNGNQPTAVVRGETILLCQNACSSSGQTQWGPAFQVSWTATQRWTSRDTISYTGVTGRSISILPNWARSPLWLAGYRSDRKTPVLIPNPTN